jgi:hypothetical protein
MTRIDYPKVAPGGVKAVNALEQYLRAYNYKPAVATTVTSAPQQPV